VAGSLGKESGHDLVGELLKGLMHLHFEVGELLGVVGQLLSPTGLLVAEQVGELCEGSRPRRDWGSKLGFGSDFH
jgi:hypothetical protein